uniref:DUF659 domain-containing protein n=1 Tax=Eutreptiella gymnastica TaxID=73025 RepID=A0A7S4LKC2_9EUGL
MFFSENACCYCQLLSSTLPVTLLFLHPLAEMLKCCFCGSKGASMTDFHDLQLKEQLLLQQKWEEEVDVDEGNVRDLCVRSVKPNKFFDKTPVAAHRDEPGQRDDSSSAQVQQVKPGKSVKPVKPEPKNKARRTVKTVTIDDRVAKFGKYGLYNGNGVLLCRCCGKRVDYNREDTINSHITSQTHDKRCAAHIAEGAPYVLAPGYNERQQCYTRKEAEKKERGEKRKRHEYVADKWDEDREKRYRAGLAELKRGKRAALANEPDVVLPCELQSTPSYQSILQPKDPRDVMDDLVWCLMSKGRPLTIVDDIRPIFRVYTGIGGHVSGYKRAASYVRPSVIKKERAKALSLLQADVDEGGSLSIIFDETTDCCDRHPVNIIVSSQKRICYVTTAFIDRKKPVNNETVGKAVLDAWEGLGLPRQKVKLVLVDNAGYCAKAFAAHLAIFFKNATLHTCWAHTANRFGATILEHPEMAPLREYLRVMRSLVHGANQSSRRQRYCTAIGVCLPDYTDTRWDSATRTAEHHAAQMKKEYQWLKDEMQRIEQEKKVVPAALEQALSLMREKRSLVHLQATFLCEFGRDIYDFIESLQVDIVPKGANSAPPRPFGHRLYSRVLQLEAQLVTLANDVTLVPRVKPLLDLITNSDLRTRRVCMMAQVAEKVLSIIRKYKRTQLPFFDELRVFDPRQRDSMPSNIDAYSHLFCRPVATFLSDLFLHGKKKDSFECRSEPSDKKCKKTSVGGRAK